MVLENLEGDVEVAGNLVGIAFVHGFRCRVYEWVDELQRGFSSHPAFQAQAVCTFSGGIGVPQGMRLWMKMQHFGGR